MDHHEIVVIGASAGGVQALTSLVGGLPAELPAALFVVLHMPPYLESRLPEILERAGPLPAAHAVDGERIVPGRIYVAPPNRHLLVRRGHVELSGGPRENHVRPAVDPLFRTAARAYGQRVVGVVLSGALYDGSSGLMAIKARGGTAIVQDPADAIVGSMPRNALQLVAADYTPPASAIASILVNLARQPVITRGGEPPMVDDDERMVTVITDDFREQAGDGRAEEMTLYTCPDCGGVLWQNGNGARLHFRCHVGHAYVPEVLLGLKSDELEAALWSSLRLLKEKATLTRQLAMKSRASGNAALAERSDDQADRHEQYANAIRDLVESLPPLTYAEDAAEPVTLDRVRASKP